MNTTSGADELGTHNSVTDQMYGVDRETGYCWGVKDILSSPLANGSVSTGGVFTDNTWPFESNIAYADVRDKTFPFY